MYMFMYVRTSFLVISQYLWKRIWVPIYMQLQIFSKTMISFKHFEVCNKYRFIGSVFNYSAQISNNLLISAEAVELENITKTRVFQNVGFVIRLL